MLEDKPEDINVKEIYNQTPKTFDNSERTRWWTVGAQGER